MANDKPLGSNGLLYFWQHLKNNFAKKTDIPTKTSDLTNDSGYITSKDVPDGASASTTTPKMDGTAAVGSETAFARGDHVHPSDTSRLATNGDGSNVTAAFTAASTRANISTGEKLSVIMGKISKWFSDLGSLAWKSSVAKTDLASDVQTSLGKADTALQSYTETDPTVPAWAKAQTKPSYTASEVGALPDSTRIPSTVAELSDSGNYALKSDLTNVYKYKGSKATLEELPTTGNTAGDVWNVEETDMNYAWTGEAWDPLGNLFSIDFLTNAEIDTILAT